MDSTNYLFNSNEGLYPFLNLEGHKEDSNFDFFSDETDSTGTSSTTSQSPSTSSSPLFSPDSYQGVDVANIQQATNALFLSGVFNPVPSSTSNPAAQQARKNRTSKRANRKYKPYTPEQLQKPDIQAKIAKRKEKNRLSAQTHRERRSTELAALREQDQQLQDLGQRLEELVNQYCQAFPWSVLKSQTPNTNPIARIQQITKAVILEAIANQDALENEMQGWANQLK